MKRLLPIILATTGVACATTQQPPDHKVSVVYEVTNGIKVILAKDVQATKVPCYDGDPEGRCVYISVKPPEEGPKE